MLHSEDRVWGDETEVQVRPLPLFRGGSSPRGTIAVGERSGGPRKAVALNTGGP